MINTIFELKHKDGRILRISCENKSQEKRIFNLYQNEDFESIVGVLNGIHDIKTIENYFEKEKEYISTKQQ